MTESLLPPPAAIPWQDKPIQALDPRKAQQPGLASFLDRIRQLDYVLSLKTTDYLQALAVSTDFLPHPQSPSLLVGWFSNLDYQNTTKFEIQTTATTREQQRAALSDMRARLLAR